MIGRWAVFRAYIFVGVGNAAVGLVCREGLKLRVSAGYLYFAFEGSLTLRHGEGGDEAFEFVLETTRSNNRDCNYDVKQEQRL